MPPVLIRGYVLATMAPTACVGTPQRAQLGVTAATIALQLAAIRLTIDADMNAARACWGPTYPTGN